MQTKDLPYLFKNYRIGKAEMDWNEYAQGICGLLSQDEYA